MTSSIHNLGLMAGKGDYPEQVIHAARSSGVRRIVCAAFEGETNRRTALRADVAEWFRVGQLGRLIRYFKNQGVENVIMAGQITPGRLFDFRPDLKALLLMAKLKKRNAETIFGAIADEMQKNGIHLLPATTFLEDDLAKPGHIAGPRANRQLFKEIEFGWPIAKQISALDIGQTVVVKKGTVLAVEGFEGTDAAIRRGGELGKEKAVAIKLSKPNQDFRFDVPVIGVRTIRTAAEVNLSAIVCEAGKTLFLDKQKVMNLANQHGITLYGSVA